MEYGIVTMAKYISPERHDYFMRCLSKYKDFYNIYLILWDYPADACDEINKLLSHYYVCNNISPSKYPLINQVKSRRLALKSAVKMNFDYTLFLEDDIYIKTDVQEFFSKCKPNEMTYFDDLGEYYEGTFNEHYTSTLSGFIYPKNICNIIEKDYYVDVIPDDNAISLIGVLEGFNIHVVPFKDKCYHGFVDENENNIPYDDNPSRWALNSNIEGWPCIDKSILGKYVNTDPYNQKLNNFGKIIADNNRYYRKKHENYIDNLITNW